MNAQRRRLFHLRLSIGLYSACLMGLGWYLWDNSRPAQANSGDDSIPTALLSVYDSTMPNTGRWDEGAAQMRSMSCPEGQVATFALNKFGRFVYCAPDLKQPHPLVRFAAAHRHLSEAQASRMLLGHQTCGWMWWNGAEQWHCVGGLK